MAENVVIFIDNGFLKLVNREFKLKYKTKKVNNIFKICKNICKKENLNLNHIYLYTAPPYQRVIPTKQETVLRERYDKFVRVLKMNSKITVKEGRCQRIFENNKPQYTQKGVDILLAIDMLDSVSKNRNLKKIILIASDSDFVPVIERIKKNGVDIILYTYFDEIRGSKFSTSNELLKSSSKYAELRPEDFD